MRLIAQAKRRNSNETGYYRLSVQVLKKCRVVQSACSFSCGAAQKTSLEKHENIKWNSRRVLQLIRFWERLLLLLIAGNQTEKWA